MKAMLREGEAQAGGTGPCEGRASQRGIQELESSANQQLLTEGEVP